MVKNIKFHSIAISIIIAVIVILYLVIGPKKVPSVAANPVASDHYVRIAGATWGKNCDELIDEALKKRNSAVPEKDSNGNLVPSKPLEHVPTNNVLATVKSLCDGKPSCEVAANPASLGGIDPLEVCYKKLTINYRCYDLDRLAMKETDQGQSVSIDCTSTPAQPDALAPAATHP